MMFLNFKIIVLMGLNFGVLLSIILKRTRKSRLTVFRQQLQKEAKQQLVLVQYPTKMIFCIVFIVAISIFVEWFAAELKADLLELSRKNITKVYPFEKINQIPYLSKELNVSHQANFKQKNQNFEHLQTLSRLKNTIIWIHFLQLILIILLLYHLSWKIVRINQRERKIKSTIYRKLGLKTQINVYYLKLKDKLQIWQLGQNRFTNTNYYYSIRIVGQDTSWQIIKKSNIYSSRTTIISIAHLYNLPYSTKIKRKDISLVQQQ